MISSIPTLIDNPNNISSISIRKLHCAIIRQAFEDLDTNHINYTAKTQSRALVEHERIARNAFRWILSNDTKNIFSFNNLCCYWGIAFEPLKKRAREMKTKQNEFFMNAREQIVLRGGD